MPPVGGCAFFAPCYAERMTTWRDRPFAPPQGTRIGPVGEGNYERAIQFGDGKDAFGLLLIRRGELLRAYRNVCPHFNVQLDAEPGLFHCYGPHVMCAHHASMFRIADGYCDEGPCAGASLEAVPIVVIDGEVRIA